MTADQIIIFAILGLAMVFFLWGRWRYDVVAFTALVAAVVGGVVPSANAFAGFGHPAVITVATVLVISRALQASGIIDHVADIVCRTARSQTSQIGTLSGLGAVLSAFMNNVGALALLMPLALRLGNKPAALLMPLSFGSILGGLITLIGTPPNIIIATFRADVAGEPFQLFDFAPVGAPVAIIGLLFVVTIGWRLIPRDRSGRKSAADLFEVRDYIAEARIPEDSDLIGRSVAELEHRSDDRSIVVGLMRGDTRMLHHLRGQVLRAEDGLLIRTDPAVLDKLTAGNDLVLVGETELSDENLRSDEIGLIEAVVLPGARIEGRSAQMLHLRRHYGAALIALARQGQPVRERLATVRFQAGDVLLLQGEADALPDTVARMGCLPLAERGLSLGRPRQVWLPIAIFAAAVLATAFGFAPVHISFSAAVIALILFNRVTPREAYETIDWSVIILLGAMIPLGGALQATGGTQLIAGTIVGLAGAVPTFVVLAVLLIVTMTLSDLMNNAATAIVMAPIGVAIAQQLGVNSDPFLMATAIGASCAFLTPIGHQNNVLVMGPGGYKFGDYWRMGLPLEVLIVIVSVPLILMFWPL
ncbi:MAG: SLC13 family permease [Alphaproteobacteria bacterium]|nr:SLC13 family permease [Alphaproteobacteria bacterium]